MQQAILSTVKVQPNFMITHLYEAEVSSDYMFRSFDFRRRVSSDSTRHCFYVCFHESASQSLVEMAFALGFGT
jgi:hypothetical protein